MHCSRQQSLIDEWLGLSVTVRVRARARECDFFHSIFFCVKVTNTFVLHVNASCDVHGVRVCDVMMMYCKEWYIEKVPFSPKSLCSAILSKQNTV